MKLAIMQPYFMPYIGYFQLNDAVDVFVVYDNIQFTKKGWFHRNRILVNGKEKVLIKKAKTLCRNEDIGVDLEGEIYALDSISQFTMLN